MITDSVVSDSQITSTRRYRRFKLDVPVRVIVNRQDHVKIVDGRGNELNEGGMAVQAGVELDVGDSIEVEFTPPYGDPLRARSAVRDRVGYRYGLEFLTESAEDKFRVEAIRIALQGMGRLMPS